MATPVIVLVVLASAATSDPPSLWRHLSTGRSIAQTGLPKLDQFTILGANRAWANPSWLFDLAVYFVHVGGGAAALIIVRFLLAAALALVLVLPARRAGSSALALPALVAVPALQSALNLSPMLPGMIILGMFAATLNRWEQQRRATTICWLAVIQILWASTASTFILGPLILASLSLGATLDRWLGGRVADQPSQRRYGVVVAAALVGCFVTPFGLPAPTGSWTDCFAAFRLDAEGQLMVSGLVPLWSILRFDAASLSFLVLAVVAVLGAVCPAIRFRTLLPAVFMSVLAVADTRLVPLAAVWLVGSCQDVLQFAGVAPGPSDADARVRTRISWLVPVTGLLAVACVLVMIARQLPDAGHRIRRQLTGSATVQTRLRILAGGEMVGTVLPLDPSDAGWLVWGHSQLRPFLDDRVSLFANDYAPYRRHCLDVVHDRDTSYRRTDGSIGGWRQLYRLVPWEWVVTRADDVETNLTLSSSSVWAPAYWDAEVVIFGQKRHSVVVGATERLEALKKIAVVGSDGVPGLYPNDSETSRLVMDTESWRNYSQREFLNMAKVYFALECSDIAPYLLKRVANPKLAVERDDWLRRLSEVGNNPADFSVQDSTTRP